MPDLLQQLNALAPLAAAATEGPLYVIYDNVEHYLLAPQPNGWEDTNGNCNDVASYNSPAEATYAAAARNLLTPAHLATLQAALASPVAVVAGIFGVHLLPATEGPGASLWGEHLYVLLPDGKVTQAMWCDFFINDFEGEAWGRYTDVDEVNPLPVQPTHYFTPPAAPTHAAQ